MDQDTGLYYFNARWYDLDTGRFISQYPVADPNNPNLYSYCANNPLTMTDPIGMDAKDDYYNAVSSGQIKFESLYTGPSLNPTTTPTFSFTGFNLSFNVPDFLNSIKDYGKTRSIDDLNSKELQIMLNQMKSEAQTQLNVAQQSEQGSEAWKQAMSKAGDLLENCSKLTDLLAVAPQSKLSLAYPMADPNKYLVFGDLSKSGIDPIFAGRLAAFAKDHNIKIYIWPNGALRDYAGQVKEFIASGGYQKPDGSWAGGNGRASKPGNSWHGFGEAIDVEAGKPYSTWLKALYQFDNVKDQPELLKYGLGKTLTIGANPKPNYPEDWHIQPIETFDITDINIRKSFYDAYTK